MKLSISNKTGMIVAITLFITINIMIFILLKTESASTTDMAKSESLNISELMNKSITFSMSQGTSDVHPFIEKVKGLNNLSELRIIPTEIIKKESSNKMDSNEQEVVKTGHKSVTEETFNNISVLRVVEPLLADESCNSCHGSKTGDALASISVRYSMENANAKLAAQRWIAIVLEIVTIGITIFIIMFFIKRKIIIDLEAFTMHILNLAKGEISELKPLDRKDEIGVMNEALIVLQGGIGDRAELGKNFAEGNFDRDVKLLSDNDILGKAFLKIKESLKYLSNDSKLLSQEALKGNLKFRTNIENHKGDFKEIIGGFNNTLDAIMKPINESGEVLENMAKGDLTVRMTGNYNGDYQLIKENINKLGNSLEKVIIEVAKAVKSTTNAAGEISTSSEEMASGANQQSSQTIEVTRAIEEMTKTILDTTKNSSLAAETAKNAGQSAKEGGKVVAQTIEGMNRIADVVKQSAITVQELGKNSDQIGEIAQVIDDIADQTNLLALNAAIEAARAGEQGRGFAVVADEVRKLAERTTKATKEIAIMIRQIQKDTNGAVESMSKGTDEVEKGKLLADKAGESLNEIILGTDKAVDVITRVAAASEEQSATSQQISQNIELINNVTRESADGISHIAKASEELSRMTSDLQNLISRFRVGNQEHDYRADDVYHEYSETSI